MTGCKAKIGTVIHEEPHWRAAEAITPTTLPMVRSPIAEMLSAATREAVQEELK